MFQFKIIKDFYLEAGPQLNFLVNSKKTTDGNYKYNDVKQAIKTNNKFRTSEFDFGYALGTGYYITPNIGVNVRYSFSVSIDQHTTDKDYAAFKGSSLFQVGLAYKF
ncbi:outer membrane beta-barrel protein [Chryseobacterium fistulae]|uniref:Outer membrane protein beta-barrel domain-containing protein n=1 Tax=Chryseobacterium fistulae TaxID=2675058 RepID=A0A6N4XZJ3_9FLAO|nr:hypothetical protein CHRY9393_03571 [Chryseobacterium fistulae]